MKPIQKLEKVENYFTELSKITEKTNQIIDRLNSLNGEEKEEPIACGDIERGEATFLISAKNLSIKEAKARLEGQIEGLKKCKKYLENVELFHDYSVLESRFDYEISRLNQQLTNLK